MPNTNPAGPFQPMNQHPLPGTSGQIIGSDGSIAGNLLPNVTNLLVEAPSDPNIVREIFSGSLSKIVGVNAGPDDMTNVVTFLRDSAGREYWFGEQAVVPPNGFFGPSLLNPMFFTAGDFTGLYLRFGGAANNPPATMYAGFYERRNVVRTRTTLNSDTPVAITPNAPEGQVNVVSSALDFTSTAITFFNFDDIPHEVFVFIVKGGTFSPTAEFITLQPLAAFVSPVPGVAAEATSGFLPWSLTLPRDSYLFAVLGEPLNGAGGVEAFVYTSLANQSPVNPSQGGSY